MEHKGFGVVDRLFEVGSLLVAASEDVLACLGGSLGGTLVAA